MVWEIFTRCENDFPFLSHNTGPPFHVAWSAVIADVEELPFLAKTKLQFVW